MASFTNLQIAELLRKIAAAYQITGENRFKIIAYEKAADSVEHLTSELKDYWDDGKLEEVPGVGASIAGHLDELFRTGKSKHFDSVLLRLSPAIYPLLLVPGLGPKKAYKLVEEFKLTDEKTVIDDLEKAGRSHKIAPLEGFGEKSEEQILANLEIYRKGQIKENRMVLPVADDIAQAIIEHLKKLSGVKRVDVLGSLRRQVSTIGDIDIAVATEKPEEVIAHFLTYPHQEIIEQGPTGTSVRLHNGRQVDVRVQKPELYGAMLQYFTGGKNHNIALRSYALKKGLSLNEYGIKHVKSGKVDHFATEEAFYEAIGLAYVPPELREDKGEVTLALANKLPLLVTLDDIRGDLHMHTDYVFETSHDTGASHFSEHLELAAKLGYEYIGISDHNPKTTGMSTKEIVSIMKRRKEYYEQQYYSWKKKSNKTVQYFLSCEVDILPSGDLALPEEAFEFVDGVVVSLHSGFTQPREQVTERIIKALKTNDKVRIFGHPTGRLLGKREGVDANWPEVFAVCKEQGVAMEINSFPDRLDLPDSLVFDAVKIGVKFCIDTDAHAVDHMNLMKYGVSVARRGWVTKHDIVNTMGYNDFKKWFIK